MSVDSEAPVIGGCPADQGPLAMDAGVCGATVTWVDPTANDNCDGVIAAVRTDITGLNSGDLFPAGITTISYSATDALGNLSTCSFDVTVSIDSEAPVISGCPADMGPLAMDALACGATVTWVDPTATDNCDGVVAVVRTDITGFNSGDLFPSGLTTISYSSTDAQGNVSICSFDITVSTDAVGPVLSGCPVDQGPLAMDAGVCGATVTWVNPTASDNCDGVVAVVRTDITGLNSGDLFPAGVTTISYSATDGVGNVSTCSFDITVSADSEAPVISGCPADQGPLPMGVGSCGATVTWVDPTANDNCDGVVAVVRTDITGLNSGDLFPAGVTTISYSATDVQGNVSSCSFDVTIEDDAEIPVIICVGDQSRSSDIGSCDYTVVGTEFDATSTDNCSSVTLINDFNGLPSLAGAVIPEGVTTILWTATDANSNIGTCQYDITVTDNELPTIACPSDISQNEDIGFSFASVVVPDAVIDDNCLLSTLTWDLTGATTDSSPVGINQIGTYMFNTGVTTVTYIVTDATGNSSTCNFAVTIVKPVPLSGSISSISNVDCFGASTGSVTVEGSDGVSPYEYSLDAGAYQNSGTFGSLAAGNYIVTVRDGALTTFDVNVTISQPASAVAGVITDQTNVLCYGSNTGSITLTGSGGVAPYQYKLGTGSYQLSGTFGTLLAGSYTVTIMDANLCSFDVQFTITQPAIAFSGNITVQTNVSCFGSSDGSVTVTGAGGTSPYDYSMDGTTFQPAGIFSGLAASTYSITVRDANLCTTAIEVVITEPAVLSIAYTKIDASCPGTADGSIALTITGGTQPYNAIWSDGILTTDRQSIPDDTYSVVVTDFNGCAESADIVIDVVGSGNCIEIPEIITPNNDGYNDTWKIKNIDLFPNAEVFVFSRWGKLVFNTKNIPANEWDGTFKGKVLPTDSYHYILHLNDGSEPRSGVISIIR